MTILTEIREVRRGSKRRLVLIDGEPWRVAPAGVLRQAGLHVDDDLPMTEIAARVREAEPRCARDRAVRLLTSRERSSAELGARLEEDGYLPDVVDETVARFRALGLLDDDRFARALARELTVTRGLGRLRATREMVARGVEPGVASEVLDETFSVEEERDSALAQAFVFARRPGATRDRVAARLVRRGYTVSVALDAARRAVARGADGTPYGPQGSSDAQYPWPGDESG